MPLPYLLRRAARSVGGENDHGRAGYEGRILGFAVEHIEAVFEGSNAMDADIRAVASKLSAEGGPPIQIDIVSSYPALPFDADCIDAIAGAEQLG